ncbi:MAG TPA: pseudouridine-5'-phosphate glycosidase, partial [Candidatus Aquilonibacter sp.]
VENDVRKAGAVPATIAVLDGTIVVGLSDAELERVATGRDMLKLSRADLPYALAAKRDGATTVAATMLCAHRAGISVFATGGIGGVHRGARETMDISADLTELARTPVIVVCAGAKAILDLSKTLEYLETLGVPTIVYGSDEFPAFWSRRSGLPAPLRLDDAQTIATTFQTAGELGLRSGMLVANPIAVESEIPTEMITNIIERAVAQAQHEGIAGKQLTPWLLDHIYGLTEGRSLEANIALVRANARLAAEIAKALG